MKQKGEKRTFRGHACSLARIGPQSLALISSAAGLFLFSQCGGSRAGPGLRRAPCPTLEIVSPTDPVVAYNALGGEFARLSEERRAYLTGVEREIIGSIPSGTRTLLDVGAGDGTRALRIAREASIQDVTLVEPAERMLTNPGSARVCRLRAEELGQMAPAFDVILCLWNVLGHIFPAQARVAALREFGRLCAASGQIFVDVSNRYNFCHYGMRPTLARFTRDQFSWSETSGDTLTSWDTPSGRVSTRGHVFHDPEFRNLARLAGLQIRKRKVVNYASGATETWAGRGHLLYTLASQVSRDYHQ